MNESLACLYFSLCPGIGPKTFLKLLHHFNSAKNAWENLDHINAKEIGIREGVYQKFISFKEMLNKNKYFGKLKKAKVQIIGYTDSRYPENLKKLKDPPICLFYKGNIDLLLGTRNIAVVGARKVTSYGREVTEKLVAELVSSDFTIVSGLAVGVDAISHETALKEKGNTIAVLGCGVDCCTPLENERLYEKILDQGGLIISEYSLGTPPSVGSFPARNRIIAGLSLGVLITEAAEDSGSLITAEEAKILGRYVFAVPGSINSAMSRGSLKLIKQGSYLVQAGRDILEVLQIAHVSPMRRVNKENFSIEERKILSVLEIEPQSLDTLSKLLKLPIVKVSVITSGLEMRGVVTNSGGMISLIV